MIWLRNHGCMSFPESLYFTFETQEEGREAKYLVGGILSCFSYFMWEGGGDIEY